MKRLTVSNPPRHGADRLNPETLIVGADDRIGPLARILGNRPDWMLDALCREHDTSLFFPPKGASARRALEVCARCTVLTECRDWALSGEFDRQGVYVGVVGGMSGSARQAAVRLRRKAERNAAP